MILPRNLSLYFLMVILFPCLGFLINLLFCKNKPLLGSKIASIAILIGFINTLVAWLLGVPFGEKKVFEGFLANEISWLVATLILFISAIVHRFSIYYMAGDRIFRRYFLLLSLITITTLMMVIADHLVLLILFLMASNMILVLLMMHKSNWSAAKSSGILAFKNFLLCLSFLLIGTGILAVQSESLSLDVITKNEESLYSFGTMVALFFIILSAFCQSGCWPFHRWLISSLNSPTPISAFMHAGLVNGGGILLARFSPLFLQTPSLLNILLMLSFISLVLGGLFKLLQSNIKSMLACSTMTQMGFMMMQCGLGFFPAALAHLCWHGLFKAFLFLKSGSAIFENKNVDDDNNCNPLYFIFSCACGLMGAIGFTFGSGLSFYLIDSSVVLIFFAWIASTQLAYTLVRKNQSFYFSLIVFVFCLFTGMLYGLTVYFIEAALEPLQISQAQTFTSIHLFLIIFAFTICIAFILKDLTFFKSSHIWRQIYVKMLNASQPDKKTITSNKNAYNY